jgi:hypothetical protein
MHFLPSVISVFAVAIYLADKVSAITCTKSKNNGGISLYGNADSDGGWLEVHRDTTGSSFFDLMFEMDCNDPSRTFDFEVYKDGDKVDSVSFTNKAVPYTHHLSSAIDHSIFRMTSIQLDTGYYTYQIKSVGETDWFGGTIQSLSDASDPEFVVGATDQSVTQGEVDSVTFPLVVKDDAVLDYLYITSNGDYVTRIGLKTSNYKVTTSTENRPVSAVVPVPTSGKAQDQVIQFRLCDAVGRCVIDEATITVSKSGGGGGGGGGDTCTLGQKGDSCSDGGDCCSGSCRGNNSCG